MSRLRSLGTLLPPAIVVVVGVGLATLPYWRTGEADWVADYDELAFYLPVGASALRDHPFRLSDPATGGPTYYQSLPAVPGLVAAELSGRGPWRLGLCWRAVGGVAVALAWYFLLRTRFAPWPAAAAACVLLSDPGVLYGQLGYVLAKACASPVALAESSLTPTAASLPQWRVMNPVLSWPWWLAFLALTARAVAVPTRGRVLAAGVACGLLFHVYFYLWTTATVGLLLAAAADRRRWAVYAGALAVALAVGAPALAASAQFRRQFGSDWLHRTDKFLLVGRFDELQLPRVSIVLLALVLVWVWRRGREWRWLAGVAAAGLLLLNQTAVTGLQIENFHWLFAFGPALSLLVVLATADLVNRAPPRVARLGPATGWALAFASVVAGGWLYARAADGLPENRRIRAAVAEFRQQVAGLELPSEGAVAGDADFQYLAAVEYGLRPLAGYTAVLSPISDAELDERVALNAQLLGESREQFRARQEDELARQRWGPEARSAGARAAKLDTRLAAWDSVAADPAAAAGRFGVRVLARPAGDPVPPAGRWVLRQSGPRWEVWVRPE